MGQTQGGVLDPIRGMYWTWQAGYIHWKIEGQFLSGAKSQFEYHIGGYRKPYGTAQLVHIPFAPENEELSVDLAPFLSRVLEKTFRHGSLSPGPLAHELASGIPNCLSAIKSMKRVLFLGLLGLFSFRSDEPSAQLTLPENFPTPQYDLEAMPWDAGISELGRTLFYDPLLSRDGSISCASLSLSLQCLRTHGSLSHGIDDSVGVRNAPALFNLAWKSHFMWDGAIELLDHQALTPLTHPSEMGDTLPHILGKLQKE